MFNITHNLINLDSIFMASSSFAWVNCYVCIYVCLGYKTIYSPMKCKEKKRAQKAKKAKKKERKEEKRKDSVDITITMKKNTEQSIWLALSFCCVDVKRSHSIHLLLFSHIIHHRQKDEKEEEPVNRYTSFRFSRWLLCAIDYSHHRRI